MNPRLCKIALLAGVGVFFFFVTLNDAILDYRGNYALVQHILGMDTLFTGDQHTWRALRGPTAGADNYWLHHVFYCTVILWNAATGVLCFIGAKKLLSARKSAAIIFNQAKNTAFAGLTLNLLLWLVALMAVAGEWFLMWQSKDWNEQSSAFRMFACLGIILVFLAQEDSELPAT